MGPLFGKVGTVAHKLRRTYVNDSVEHGPNDPSKFNTPRHETIKGFKRMLDDDQTGVESTVRHGSPIFDSDVTVAIPMHKIVVETDVEQNYEDRSTGKAL